MHVSQQFKETGNRSTGVDARRIELLELQLPRSRDLVTPKAASDLFFVQEKVGSLPPTVGKQGNQNAPRVPVDDKSVNDAAKAIRRDLFAKLDGAKRVLDEKAEPLILDLALGGPGSLAGYQTKRDAALKEAERTWNDLGLPQTKKLDEAQAEILKLLAANNGHPETNAAAIAIYKKRLLEAAGLANDTGLPAFPVSGWDETVVKGIVAYLKNETVQMRSTEKFFLLCVGGKLLGEPGKQSILGDEPGEPWTVSADIPEKQKAMLELYMTRKYGADQKAWVIVRDQTWKSYRTGVFGPGTAGRIEKEIPQGPLDKATEAYNTFFAADRSLFDAYVLANQRAPRIYARLTNPADKDPELTKIRAIMIPQQRLMSEAFIRANSDLQAIGQPPVTTAELIEHYKPKAAPDKK